MTIYVKRPLEGISLNAGSFDEYLIDEDRNPMGFESEKDAKAYLRVIGADDDDMAIMKFVELDEPPVIEDKHPQDDLRPFSVTRARHYKMGQELPYYANLHLFVERLISEDPVNKDLKNLVEVVEQCAKMITAPTEEERDDAIECIERLFR